MLLPWNGDFLMLQVWLSSGRMLGILTVSALPVTIHLPSLIPTSSCFLKQVLTLYHVNFLKKARISFTQYEKESLSNMTVLQQRSRSLQRKNTFIEKKNTELLFMRLQNTCKEMEASLCVMRIVVYCICTGPCGLEWFHFFDWHKKISAIITLSSRGAEVGALL